MKVQTGMWKSLLGIVVIGAIVTPCVHGQDTTNAKTWNKQTGGTYEWSETTNWVDGNAPEATETSLVYISLSGNGSQVNIHFDSDQVLSGGLLPRIQSSNPARITLDLDGHRLTLNNNSKLWYRGTSVADAGSNRIMFRVIDGTVQFGTGSGSENQAGMHLSGYYEANAGRVTQTVYFEFGAGSTLDSQNMSEILIGQGTNHTRSHNVTLDTREAVLKSGDQNHTLKVNGNIELGHSTTTSGNNGFIKRGSILLGYVESVQIGGDLILGVSKKTGSGSYRVEGSLEFAGAGQGEADLSIGGNLYLGVGPRSVGEIINSPRLNVTIGSETVRGGAVHIGYKNTTGGYILDDEVLGHATGTWVAGEGTWNAWVTELRIGQVTTGSNGNAYGTLDLRDMELGVFDISGAAIIGLSATSAEAVGKLYLNGGTVTSASLTVGETFSGDRSLLELNGTLWSTESVSIGARGDLYINVGQGQGGLDILSSISDNFLINEDGLITVNFDYLPGAADIYWGIRMEGDHEQLFLSLLSDGVIVADGNFAAYASVFAFDGYTYFGVQAIPEPAELALWLMAGLVLVRVWTGRNRGRA